MKHACSRPQSTRTSHSLCTQVRRRRRKRAGGRGRRAGGQGEEEKTVEGSESGVQALGLGVGVGFRHLMESINSLCHLLVVKIVVEDDARSRAQEPHPYQRVQQHLHPGLVQLFSFFCCSYYHFFLFFLQPLPLSARPGAPTPRFSLAFYFVFQLQQNGNSYNTRYYHFFFVFLLQLLPLLARPGAPTPRFSLAFQFVFCCSYYHFFCFFVAIAPISASSSTYTQVQFSFLVCVLATTKW